MSGIHEVAKELFWAIEEEGQWMVVIGGDGPQLYVGPFGSPYAAAEWGREFAGGFWVVNRLMWPEEYPGAATAPPVEREDPMLEFGDEPLPEELQHEADANQVESEEV